MPAFWTLIRTHPLLLIVAAFNAFIVMLYMHPFADIRHVDLPQLQAAGRLVAGGQVSRIYDPAAYTQSAYTRYPYAPYFNRPAWYALLFFPTAYMTYGAFVRLAMIVNYSLLGLLIWKLPHWFPSVPHARVLLFAYQPFLWSIVIGQDTLLLTLLVAYGARQIIRGEDVRGGILLALATFKPHLLIALPFALAAGRRWRSLSAFTLVSTGLALFSFALVGRSGLRQWITLLQSPTTDAYLHTMGNTRMLYQNFGAPLGITAAIAIVALGAFAFWRAALPGKIAAALVVGPLLSPHTYLQDYSLAALASVMIPVPVAQYLALVPWPYFWPGEVLSLPFMMIGVGVLLSIVYTSQRHHAHPCAPPPLPAGAPSNSVPLAP
jgi:alpha-1,2-mannosyltransferase